MTGCMYAWPLLIFPVLIHCLLPFQPEKCKHYQLAVQSLCATVKPHRTIDNTRYEGAVSMIYPSRDSTDSESEADMVVDSGFGSDVEELDEVNQEAYDLDTKTEKAGVLHLSHGWIQRGQKKKVNFSSSSYQLFLL